MSQAAAAVGREEGRAKARGWRKCGGPEAGVAGAGEGGRGRGRGRGPVPWAASPGCGAKLRSVILAEAPLLSLANVPLTPVAFMVTSAHLLPGGSTQALIHWRSGPLQAKGDASSNLGPLPTSPQWVSFLLRVVANIEVKVKGSLQGSLSPEV